MKKIPLLAVNALLTMFCVMWQTNHSIFKHSDLTFDPAYVQ